MEAIPTSSKGEAIATRVEAIPTSSKEATRGRPSLLVARRLLREAIATGVETIPTLVAMASP